MKTALVKDAAGILRTFDSLDTPVFLIDEDFTVISCNESARIFFLYGPDEIAGRPLDTFVLPDRRHALRVAALRRNEPRDITSAYPDSHFISSVIKKNGDFVEARVSIIPCQENASSHKLVVLNDISEQRKLQRKAFQRTKEL